MKKLLAFFFALSIVISFLNPSLVFAEEVIEEEKNNLLSPALQISPVTARVGLEPGQVLEKSFEVKNISDDAFTFRVYTSPYSIKDNHYNLDFETETSYTQISRWIKFYDDSDNLVEETKFDLPAGETKNVKYQITVPDDVAGGGQYASIFAETLADEVEGSGITTISRAGLIVYGSIAGETRREVKIGDLSLDNFLFGGNVNIHADVENTGNIDFQAATEITVKSIFGKELYTDTSISTLLPETKRQIDIEWAKTPLYGIFNLHYKISALGTEMETNRVILVMPPFIIFTTVVLVSITVIVVIVYIRKKKSNKTGRRCETSRF